MDLALPFCVGSTIMCFVFILNAVDKLWLCLALNAVDQCKDIHQNHCFALSKPNSLNTVGD